MPDDISEIEFKPPHTRADYLNELTRQIKRNKIVGNEDIRAEDGPGGTVLRRYTDPPTYIEAVITSQQYKNDFDMTQNYPTQVPASAFNSSGKSQLFRYGWQEVRPTPRLTNQDAIDDLTKWEIDPDGRSGDAESSPAYERRRRAVPIGTKVRLWPLYSAPTKFVTDSGGVVTVNSEGTDDAWVFDYTPTTVIAKKIFGYRYVVPSDHFSLEAAVAGSYAVSLDPYGGEFPDSFRLVLEDPVPTTTLTGFDGSAATKYLEFGSIGLDLPSDPSRIYMAIAKCTAKALFIQGGATRLYPIMPGYDSFGADTGGSYPTNIGDGGGCLIDCWLEVGYRLRDTVSPTVYLPLTYDAHIFSIDTTRRATLKIPATTDSDGDTIDAQYISQPVTFGYRMGSAVAKTELNRTLDILYHSYNAGSFDTFTEPPAQPFMGAWTADSPPTQMAEVFFRLRVEATGFTGDIYLDLDFNPDQIIPVGSMNGPALYVMQMDRTRPIDIPTPAAPPSPPPPPPPPGTVDITFNIDKLATAGSYPTDLTIKNGVGSTVATQTNLSPPDTFVKPLLPADTYTITAQRTSDAAAETVAAPTSGIFTLDAGGVVTVGGSGSAVTVRVTFP